jgi:inorganic phosphate transporter, PiT family
MALWLGVAAALAFSATNGLHDAANAIATLVATRGATPGQAALLSAVFNMLGAVLVGTAVAGTVAGIVTVARTDEIAVAGSAALAAVAWNLLTWRLGLPSSSGHALVGGLVGAGLVASGSGAVNWGGMHGIRPSGVFGVLIVLAVSPVFGLFLGAGASTVARAMLRRATRAVERPIRAAQLVMTAALSFSHGANDAQKAMGVIAVLLVGGGRLETPSVPLWVKLACGATLTCGTALGGWRIVRTIGSRIFHLAPIDAFASQSASTAVILGSSFLGAPVSTTQVVATSVVGVGWGRRRLHHVHWPVVKGMMVAWVLTLPATIALGAAASAVWRSAA